jgi:hypothetical protein
MNDLVLLTNDRVGRASAFQLVYQGLYLHYASLWGPLRASKRFRTEEPLWLFKVLTRWFKEYGLNFIILLLILATFALYVPHLIVLGSAISVAALPLLTVTQMFIDSSRKDIVVLFDREASSGLTVKKSIDIDGRTVWAFYNHFALPIGDKKGVFLRSRLHMLALENKVMLVCHAQSKTVAKYYLDERTSGNDFGGSRPFLVWNYTTDADNNNVTYNKEGLLGFFKKLFGVTSIRNSGQFPLGNLKVAF